MGKETKDAAPSTEELLNQKIAELEAIVAEQAAYITKLETAKESKPEAIKPTVKIGKNVYKVNFGILHNQQKFTAQQLAENIELCKEILATDGQTHLTLLED